LKSLYYDARSEKHQIKLNTCFEIKKRSRWCGEEKNLLLLTDAARILVTISTGHLYFRVILPHSLYGVFKLW